MDFSLVLLILISFFLLISPFSYYLTLFNKDEKSTNYKAVHLLGLFLLCMICLILIDVFTMDPRTISGNGNPALFIVIPFLMLLAIFLTSLFLFFRSLFEREFKHKLFPAVLFSVLMVFAGIRYISKGSNLLTMLGGDPENPQSVIYRYPWLNQYTNSLFFNGYLLLFLIALTLFISLFVARGSEKDEKRHFL